jgi:GntR family transcriptional regulator
MEGDPTQDIRSTTLVRRTPFLAESHHFEELILNDGQSRECPIVRREQSPFVPLFPDFYDTIQSSSMQISKVNKDEPIALHDQVAAEIRRAIADGEATQGERLPPAVDLATVLGVNKNTVIRALHILRDEGLLDFTRGRGVRVVGTPQRGALMTRIEELLAFARTQGYRREEVVALIQARR